MDTEIIELEQKALTMNEQAKNIAVNTQTEYNHANDFIVNIKKLQKQVKDTFVLIIKKAFEAHRESKAQEAKHLDPLLKAEEIIKSKMLIFIRVQEQVRLDAERKLQVEAERKRQEAIAKAEAARANGKEAKAEKYEEKAANIVAPQLASTVDKGSASVRKRYRAEVYDLMALVKAIAAGQAPISFVEPNMPALNSQARALENTMAYPGIKVIAEDSLAIRS